MQIDFNSSPGPSLGIEVELEVVDQRHRRAGQRGHRHPRGAGRGPPRRRAPEGQARAVRVHGRGHHRRLPDGGRGPGRPRGHDRRGARGRPTRGASTLLCSGTHPFSHWQDQTVSPNPRYDRARRRDAVDGQAAPDLRRPRPRRHPLAGEGGGHRQRPGRLHPALPGAVGVEPVLGGRRHRAGVEPQQGVRGPAHRRAPGADRELGRTSSSSWRRSCPRRPSAPSARCGGTSARTRTSARSSCACATASRPCRRSARSPRWPRASWPGSTHLDDRGYTLPAPPGLGAAPEQVAGRTPRPRRDLIIDAQGSLRAAAGIGRGPARRARARGARLGCDRRAGPRRRHPRGGAELQPPAHGGGRGTSTPATCAPWSTCSSGAAHRRARERPA